MSRRVLDELGIDEVFVAGLAKRFEEVFVPGEPDPIRIPRDSEALYLLQQVRDEAHRFADHLSPPVARQKVTRSVLDGVLGLGGFQVVLEENPCIIKLANSWVLMNPGIPRPRQARHLGSELRAREHGLELHEPASRRHPGVL